ncbi:MAG: hypothetical protein HDR51_00315 [Treponema sp.]|nr:hypothetical protein [Treponema sp.]
MFLKIKECAYLIETSPRHLYYLAEFKEAFFFKIISSYRITEEDVEVLYDKIFFQRNGRMPSADERAGYRERLTYIKAGRIPCDASNRCGVRSMR